MPSRSSHDSDLSGSLEEFGLSKYEARAYLTMIGKGSLAASEIAYYSNLPRTKIYQTLKKLEKKRLAVVSKQKPLICSAVPPEEAFAELVGLHERRLRNMKKVIEQLQKQNDEGQRPKGSEERRYFVLDANSTLEKIMALIASSRHSVLASLDEWGLRLLSQCKAPLVRALTNGAKARVILASHSASHEGFGSIPEAVELRLSADSPLHANFMIVDSASMIAVDGSNGRAALFSSQDPFVGMQLKSFEAEWGKASEIKSLAGSEDSAAATAVRLTRALENGMSSRLLEYAFSAGGAETSPELVEVIDEKYGLKIGSMSPPQIMDVVDSALRISCMGGLKHDQASNTVSLQSKVQSRHALPWALVLASYFKRSGNDVRVTPQGAKNLQVVHLKLSKAI